MEEPFGLRVTGALIDPRPPMPRQSISAVGAKRPSKVTSRLVCERSAVFPNNGWANTGSDIRLLPNGQLKALFFPLHRQRLEQIIELKRAGLASGQDRLDDIWRDQGQP